MAILYSCRHDGDQYRMTKWDDDFNIESSYLCTIDECECPAGSRPICRHREMLPLFLRRWETHRTDDNSSWYYDYDRGGWVLMHAEINFEPHGPEATTADFDSANGGSNPPAVANDPVMALADDDLVECSSVVERGNHNPVVAGSIPATPTKPRDGRRV